MDRIGQKLMIFLFHLFIACMTAKNQKYTWPNMLSITWIILSADKKVHLSGTRRPKPSSIDVKLHSRYSNMHVCHISVAEVIQWLMDSMEWTHIFLCYGLDRFLKKIVIYFRKVPYLTNFRFFTDWVISK